MLAGSTSSTDSGDRASWVFKLRADLTLDWSFLASVPSGDQETVTSIASVNGATLIAGKRVRPGASGSLRSELWLRRLDPRGSQVGFQTLVAPGLETGATALLTTHGDALFVSLEASDSRERSNRAWRTLVSRRTLDGRVEWERVLQGKPSSILAVAEGVIVATWEHTDAGGQRTTATRLGLDGSSKWSLGWNGASVRQILQDARGQLLAVGGDDPF